VSAIRYRPVKLGGSLSARIETRPDGTVHVASTEALGEYPDRLTDCLIAGAKRHPERILAAKRGKDDRWIELRWGEALDRARSIGQSLLDRGLGAERPLVMLSDNDLEHFQLGLGALLVGVPFAPISPAYSLVSQDYGKLKTIVSVLQPGLVFCGDAGAFAKAIAATLDPDIEIVATQGTLAGRSVTSFQGLSNTAPTSAVDAAAAKVGPDTIAKFLFTSGSLRQPKAVINTQRMLCSNQQAILQCFPGLADAPPVLVDWLPWNHTFGGNHNIGITLYHGGTLYIDDGKPVPALIGRTLRNLREVAPTVYFNVPKGFEEIAAAMENDDVLRRNFFSRVSMLFFAGAGLSQPVWDRLDRLAEATVGERIRVFTGLGMTETAPFAICANGPEVKSGYVGLPVPGMNMKLVPVAGKMEVRYRAPFVTPGYWRNEEQTRASFDDEGYFRSGDALRPIDPAEPHKGYAFDGRIAEDFKLSSGTFVSVGPLRARAIALGAPYVQDVVVTGMDRDDVGIMIFPRLDDCRRLAGASAQASAAEISSAPPVRKALQSVLDALWRSGTGGANRVARALVLIDPPSIDKGEVTDKGSINQRAVLTHRAALVEALYQASDPAVMLPGRG
jgi:feruloyl-CoA synthase